MGSLDELQQEVSAALVAAQADGVKLGYDQAVSDFFGQNAAFLLANIFADAMEAAAGRLASHDANFATRMQQLAGVLRASVLQPQVTAVTPAAGTTGDPSSVTVKFNEDMDSSTIVASAFDLTHNSVADSVLVAYDAKTRTATLTPQVAIAAGQTVEVTVGLVKNAQGVAMGAAYTWSFTAAAPG